MTRYRRWMLVGVLALAQVGIIVCYAGLLRGDAAPPAPTQNASADSGTQAKEPKQLEPMPPPAPPGLPPLPSVAPAPQDAPTPLPGLPDNEVAKDSLVKSAEPTDRPPVPPSPLPSLDQRAVLADPPLPPTSPSAATPPAPSAVEKKESAPPPLAVSEPPTPTPMKTPLVPPTGTEPSKPADVVPPPPLPPSPPAQEKFPSPSPVPQPTQDILPARAFANPTPVPIPSIPPSQPVTDSKSTGTGPITGLTSAPSAPCPWALRMEIVKGRTELEARIGKEVQFRVTCARLSIEAPSGCLTAKGDVKITGSELDGSCESLSINWQDDHVFLEGHTHVKCLRNGQDVDLNAERLSLKLSTSSSVKGTGSRRRPLASSTEPPLADSEDADLK